MSEHYVGERVGAILGADRETGVVEFLGFGTYMGREMPPRPLGFMASMFPEEHRSSWDKILDYYKNKMNIETTVEAIAGYNPKIILDNGHIVWGCECWWGSEEQIKKRLETAEKVITIDPSNVPSMFAQMEKSNRAERQDNISTALAESRRLGEQVKEKLDRLKRNDV